MNFPQTKHFLHYKLINRGRTPALLVERYHAFAIPEAGQMPVAVDPATTKAEKLPVGIDCSIDRPAKFSIDVLSSISAEELGTVFQRKKRLFLIGFIRYQDIFKQTHVIGFCARLDLVVNPNRFVLVGDERYNYAKDE